MNCLDTSVAYGDSEERIGRALAAAAGIGMAELALRYMLSQQGVTCIITGVESLDQIRQNIALFSKGPLEASLVVAVAKAVPELPERVVSPFLWSKGVS